VTLSGGKIEGDLQGGGLKAGEEGALKRW